MAGTEPELRGCWVGPSINERAFISSNQLEYEQRIVTNLICYVLIH